jgi:hypothetical protein
MNYSIPGDFLPVFPTCFRCFRHRKAVRRRESGVLSDDANVLHLAEGGFEGFIQRTSARILDESRHLIFFNRCPKCGGLARTPTARQCRYCAHEWRAKD